MTTPAPSRPVLRYHGGKWRLAPWIIGHFPPHELYCEPFCGAASVLLRKSPARCEVINDIDDEVVNLFHVLRDRKKARELTRLLELTPFSRVEYLRAYEPTDDPVERARRSIIRSAMGMGSDAFNPAQKTGFRGKRTQSQAPVLGFVNFSSQIKDIIQRLRRTVIENMGALACIEQYDGPGTLFYCDPPYVLSTRTRTGTGAGYTHELTDADHEALAARLHAAKGMVVLSGYDSELYRDLYPDWPVFRRNVYADKAVPRTECLWLSPRTAARLDRRSTLLEMVG